jgi:hypothetical protein
MGSAVPVERRDRVDEPVPGAPEEQDHHDHDHDGDHRALPRHACHDEQASRPWLNGR